MYSDGVWSGSIRISEVLLYLVVLARYWYLVVFLAIFHIARLMVRFPT